MHNSCTFIFNINKKNILLIVPCLETYAICFSTSLKLFYFLFFVDVCVHSWKNVHILVQYTDLTSRCCPPHFTPVCALPEETAVSVSVCLLHGDEAMCQRKPAALPQHSSPSFSAYHSRAELFSPLTHPSVPPSCRASLSSVEVKFSIRHVSNYHKCVLKMAQPFIVDMHAHCHPD